MIPSATALPLRIALALLIAVPAGFAQPPQAPAKPAAPEAPASPLTVAVIEGNNAINSIRLLRSVTPVVEVRDPNDFPVEGATVVFTLPESGPGGTFLGGRTIFSTRSDAHGQALAPFTVNNFPGKFQIKVTATLGNRKGEAAITQTNSMGGYIGPLPAQRSWYKKWPTWAIAGAAAAAVTALVITGRSGRSSQSTVSPTTVTITAGGPVFH